MHQEKPVQPVLQPCSMMPNYSQRSGSSDVRLVNMQQRCCPDEKAAPDFFIPAHFASKQDRLHQMSRKQSVDHVSSLPI